jgi:hypothetical protein
MYVMYSNQDDILWYDLNTETVVVIDYIDGRLVVIEH